MQNAAAFVLAGGQSSRMGEDKAFLKLNGRTLLEIALANARTAAGSASIVGPRQKFGPQALEDIYANQGPLAGIHAALQASAAEINLVLAVDLPFVEVKFLDYLLRKAAGSSAVVVVPQALGRWQPLCAVYRKQFLDAAGQALAQGHNKIDMLFGNLPTCVIDDDELDKAGFAPSMFDNLNTPADLCRGERRISGGNLLGRTT